MQIRAQPLLFSFCPQSSMLFIQGLHLIIIYISRGTRYRVPSQSLTNACRMRKFLANIDMYLHYIKDFSDGARYFWYGSIRVELKKLRQRKFPKVTQTLSVWSIISQLICANFTNSSGSFFGSMVTADET